ncbi:chitin binding, partial [Rhizoctonia solani]
LHGGWEGFNLFELNYVSVPYSHRSGLARAVAARAETKRRERGIQFGGKLIQIQKKALPLSNFAGVLERKQVNGAVLRAKVDGGEYVEYRPYFARDGSLSSKIWQLGWDSQSPAGIRYSHLSVENRAPIKDWQSHELVDYSKGPAYGANSLMEDPHTSRAQVVLERLGGWALVADPANMVAIATSASARTKLGHQALRFAKVGSGNFCDAMEEYYSGAAPGLKAANFNLSMSTPHSFWSSSGVNTVAADLSKAVDFTSLISHDLSGATLEYPNSLPKMSAAVMNIHKLGFPRGLENFPIQPALLMDVGLHLALDRLQSAYRRRGSARNVPIFCYQRPAKWGTLDEDSNGESTEIDGSAARYVTGTGYVFDYETPASVVEKARAATMLCLGGLSISALDQDNRKFELTTAIWGAGALVPTAAEIASTISGEPLTENGLVSVDFWDKAADQILAKYPSLSMQLNYQVMLLLGIRALDAVASSLYEYLKFSALSEDSFALYKHSIGLLQTKQEKETTFGNAHPGGFSNYLVESLGMDTSNLIIGDIYVGRNPSTCISFPLRRELSSNATNVTLTLKYDDAVRKPMRPSSPIRKFFEDDGTGRVRRVQVEGFSPYDPDKDCRTLWHDVLLIDADKFFPNIKDGIQAYLDQYGEFKLSAINLASSPFETVESLAPSLYLTLTTLTSGNDTLYSTMQYIRQALQEQYDALEEQARQAGIQLIIDIVLTLLSFVPFGGLVGSSDAFPCSCLEKALDGAMDARSLRHVQLSGAGFTLPTSARRSFLYNDTFTEPSGQDLSTIDSTSPIINPNESKRSEWSHLHSRAPAQVETCIWRPKFNAAEFKSKNYRSFCHDTSALYPMEWVDVDNNNEVKKVTYADCRPPNGNDRTTVAAGMRFADKDKRKAKNLPPDPKY